MLDHELAKRLVGYADAMVALSFVSISAFGLAVADPDIRCSLAGANASVIIANVLVAGLFSFVLLLLRRWEKDLGADGTLSFIGRKYSGYLNVGRYLLIWFSAAMGCALVIMIHQSSCSV